MYVSFKFQTEKFDMFYRWRKSYKGLTEIKVILKVKCVENKIKAKQKCVREQLCYYFNYFLGYEQLVNTDVNVFRPYWLGYQGMVISITVTNS